MRKTVVILLFLLGNVWALSAQKQEKTTNKAGDSTWVDQQADYLPDYISVKPTPRIILDSSEIVLRDYKISVQVDSVWQALLMNSELYPKMRESILTVPYAEKDMSVMDYQELPTKLLKKRLAKLDAKSPFHIKYTPDVERMIHIYLNRNKEGMEKLMALSEYYFPLFEKVLDQYDLPLELKFLPIVESALNPQAKSPVGATGLWQFMFGTGRMQGLTISSYVDERMDPVKSTDAAVRYLAKLYGMFNNWDLALASYNAGPGNVSDAIRRGNGETDYWKIRPYLPRETANYVPAFVAVMYIFNYADQHGYDPYQPRVVYFQTDTIHVKQTIKFEQISKVTGIDPELLEFLNPSYKLNIIPFIEGKDYYVRLPIREAGLFIANEDLIYAYVQHQLKHQNLPRYYEANDKIRYRVRPGDYLGRIASRFGVSVSDIRSWNGISGSVIRVGEHLTIYPHKFVKLKSVASSTSHSASSNAAPKTYVVRSGDSLWSISRKFKGISISQIKEWNDISGNTIKPGMQLQLSNS